MHMPMIYKHTYTHTHTDLVFLHTSGFAVQVKLHRLILGQQAVCALDVRLQEQVCIAHKLVLVLLKHAVVFSHNTAHKDRYIVNTHRHRKITHTHTSWFASLEP
jgi:hypothetical protein